MTTVIYKHAINTPNKEDGRTILHLPCDYKILSAGFMHSGKDAGMMCIWVQQTKETNPLPGKLVYIEVYGTGEMLPDPETLKFIGTVHVDPFTLPEVFHVYQRFGYRL